MATGDCGVNPNWMTNYTLVSADELQKMKDRIADLEAAVIKWQETSHRWGDLALRCLDKYIALAEDRTRD